MIRIRYMSSVSSQEQYSPRSARMHEKLAKLEVYQFEDLMQMLASKRYRIPGQRDYVPSCSPSKADSESQKVIHAQSVICFVLLMNDICRPWMLIQS